MEAIINTETVTKTFVFQKEETQQSVIVDYEINLRQGYANIGHLISAHCPQTQHNVSIYDPNLNQFVPLRQLRDQNGYISKQFLETPIILVRYKRIQEFLGDSDSFDSNIQQQYKQKRDGRSKERTIGEVIESVKRWRNLHLYGHKSFNRRLNLQEAAKVVKISKKSLDDYYCQLRLGELYGFDFGNKLHQKMGVLRSFVKEYRPQKDQKRKNQKHPKNLRIIEQYDLENHALRPYTEQEQQVEMIQHEIQLRNRSPQNIMEERYEQIPNNEPLSQELFHLEHDFFRGFQFVLEEPEDPYFQIDRDFNKKTYEEQSNSFLYF